MPDFEITHDPPVGVRAWRIGGGDIRVFGVDDPYVTDPRLLPQVKTHNSDVWEGPVTRDPRWRPARKIGLHSYQPDREVITASLCLIRKPFSSDALGVVTHFGECIIGTKAIISSIARIEHLFISEERSQYREDLEERYRCEVEVLPEECFPWPREEGREYLHNQLLTVAQEVASD